MAGLPGKALACIFSFGLDFFHPDPFPHFLKNCLLWFFRLVEVTSLKTDTIEELSFRKQQSFPQFIKQLTFGLQIQLGLKLFHI